MKLVFLIIILFTELQTRTFHYRLRSPNSRDENIRFEILNLSKFIQNHLLKFYLFELTNGFVDIRLIQREMLNSAMFFIFIAKAVCGIMQGTPNARILMKEVNI